MMADDFDSEPFGPVNGRPIPLRGDGQTLPLFNLDALDGLAPPERQWIVQGFIPAGEVTLLTGAGGVGKSLLSQQLATCLASGAPFLGVQVERRTVLYVTAEDDEAELHRRQRNMNCSVPPGSLKGHLHLSSLRGRLGNELATFDRDGAIEATDTFTALRNTIATVRLDVLILDNIAHLFAGNENDRGQVTRFVNLLYSLSTEFGVTILLIGHPNKSGDAYSGSTAWLNAVRSQVEIVRPNIAADDCIDPDARVLRVGKANYARHGSEIAFRWHDHGFTCEDELPADTRLQLAEAQRVAHENETFLSCLRVRQGQDRPPVGPSVGPNYAPAQFAKMTEAKGLSKAALERAMERLFHVNAIATKQVKRKGNDTKTIIVECAPNPSERPSERGPNTGSELFRTSVRTGPNTHLPPKGGTRAGPHDGPPPDDGKMTDDATHLVPMPPKRSWGGVAERDLEATHRGDGR